MRLCVTGQECVQHNVRILHLLSFSLSLCHVTLEVVWCDCIQTHKLLGQPHYYSGVSSFRLPGTPISLTDIILISLSVQLDNSPISSTLSDSPSHYAYTDINATSPLPPKSPFINVIFFSVGKNIRSAEIPFLQLNPSPLNYYLLIDNID